MTVRTTASFGMVRPACLRGTIDHDECRSSIGQIRQQRFGPGQSPIEGGHDSSTVCGVPSRGVEPCGRVALQHACKRRLDSGDVHGQLAERARLGVRFHPRCSCGMRCNSRRVVAPSSAISSIIGFESSHSILLTKRFYVVEDGRSCPSHSARLHALTDRIVRPPLDLSGA